ncbi:hypothetical protein E9993_04810 [Labilibacter sediminis]|nr:hypothetical protein E9993_04810 [Labilibacter sediminis]
MMLISQIYRHQHKLSQLPIWIRAIYVLPCFVLVLCNKSELFNALVSVVYLALSIVVTGVSLRQMLLLFRAPLFFIVTGCLTIALTFNDPHPFFTYKGFSFGWAQGNLSVAVQAFSRSMALVSMVYFGLLTHTISEIAEALKYIRVPKILIELFILTFKFIENLMRSAQQMYTAQKCRLAYNGRKRLKSLSILVFAILRNAIAQTSQLQVAMESRLLDDKFDFIHPKYKYHPFDVIWPTMITYILFGSFLIIRYYGW